ncbi:12900_t:CDS:1 [Racocetra persica]|uniref:12900_t:CDS:1 n=1 Tax=Racocetra persica TaxID=160502 RepID=A0ACA9LI84_9GLOM|nr:12900_t:CDS:1 [Racocetra persica]
MKPELMPRVKEMCEEFVSSFVNREYQNIPPEKLIHDGTWKESEEEIASVIRGLFTLLEEIWINPAFNSELAKSLNEGTYQSTVILLSIRAILKNLPFSLFSFISASERQSIASSDRKGKGRGRRPDIMFVIKYLEIFFELMYLECPRLYCDPRKKTDDEIKLWRETNDGIYWVRRVLKPEKEQFGIVGVQIAGNILHLNVLVRDIADIHRYLHIQSAEIPSSADTVTKFVETLLFLRNILITNLSLLYHASASISERQKENSTNVDSE